MLKSLGVVVSQATRQFRSSDQGSPRGRFERAQQVAQRTERRRRRKTVIILSLIFIILVLTFSFLFHEIMAREGRTFSWPTGIYWTMTTMTTLGFGDITFTSDLGRLFSVLVLVSGSAFLLVVLPFAFIQFVFIPWINERERRRAPRTLPQSTSGHLILTALGPIEQDLIDRADKTELPYVLVVEDVDEAGRLHDEGRNVIVGALDDPGTYHNARVEHAAFVVATQNDQINTNIAFTVQEIAPDTTILSSANSPAAVDILEIAGADHVVQLGNILGNAMAARSLGLGGQSHQIGNFAGLQIAEAGVVGTALADRTLQESQLRSLVGVGIIGVWDRGDFSVATRDTKLCDSSILLLAGTADQLARFDEKFAVHSPTDSKAIIIGGGRVGRAAAQSFMSEGIDVTIIDRLAERRRSKPSYVIGDAADRSVLEAAGIEDAGAILITTHDDNVNVYLTRYCRGLRPDARIVSRSNLGRNVTTLYRAGADAVLSYAGTGSATIWNHFRGDETLLVAQGLNMFRTPIPRELIGSTLADSHIYRRTNCNVVAIEHNGTISGNPDAHQPLPVTGELLLVGTDAAEEKFSEVFPHARRRPLLTRGRR